MGTGRPLVLIHGWRCYGHWRKNIPVLAAGGYQVFALDLLGFGGSDKPALDYTWLWEELLKDFWTAHSGTAVFVGNWRTAESDGSSRLSNAVIRGWSESSSPRILPTS